MVTVQPGSTMPAAIRDTNLNLLRHISSLKLAALNQPCAQHAEE